MPFTKTYTGLDLWLARDEGQGYYIYGVTVNGADIQLGAVPIGAVDPELAAAKEAQTKETDAAPAESAAPASEATPAAEQGPGVSTASEAVAPEHPESEPPATMPADAAPPEA